MVSLNRILPFLFLALLIGIKPAFCDCKYPEIEGDFTLKYRINAFKINTRAPISSYTLTISKHNNDLLMIKDVPKSPAGARQLVKIYDGTKTYNWIKNERFAEIKSGFHFGGFSDIVLPGVNLPAIPFMKDYHCENTASRPVFSGKVALFNTVVGDDRPAYYPGTVLYDAQSTPIKLLKYEMVFSNAILLTYNFNKPQLFKGIWLPEEIQVTTYTSKNKKAYEAPKDLKNLKTIPDEQYTSQLVSASSTSLDPKLFDLATYLDKNTDVADSTMTPPISFRYNPKIGSIPIQEHHQSMLNQALKKKTETGLMSNRNSSGFFVLAALIFGGAGWMFWRRKNS